jgi:hypothetical protein
MLVSTILTMPALVFSGATMPSVTMLSPPATIYTDALVAASTELAARYSTALGYSATLGFSLMAGYSTAAGYPTAPMLGLTPSPLSMPGLSAFPRPTFGPSFFPSQLGQFFSNQVTSNVVTIASAITIKLTSENYMTWRAHVGPLLRRHLLMGYVDGSFVCPAPHIVVSHGGGVHQQPNPAYQQDQAILSAFVFSMTESVVGMAMFASSV